MTAPRADPPAPDPPDTEPEFPIMAEATFRHGVPTMVDYTPGSAVDAGDVIVTGDTVRIAHLDIAANALGALAATGGVYEVTGDAAIAADKKVWWNAAASKVTETASTHKVFGITVTACAADDGLCLVRHAPAVPANPT